MKTMHLLPPALLVSVLLGCASPRIIPMTEGAASKIKSTEAILVLSQQEIAAEINPSAVAAAGGGGLLLALVDVAVNKSRADDAEAAIAPIKNALLDYDFPKQLRVALEEELRRLAWINLQSLRTVSSPDTKKIDGEVAASAATAVLVIRTTYSLTSDFSFIKVKAAVTGYPKTEELSAIAKQARPDTDPPLLYRNDFSVMNGMGQRKSDRPTAAKAWAENNGKAARDALGQAASDLAKRIAADLESARANAKAAASASTATASAGR
jgi:hypothetical protein